MQVTEDDLSAYQDLYDQLRQAYWAASNIESKDMLIGLKEAVSDILTDLNRSDLQEGTAEYQTLTTSIKTVNDKLATLKSKIDNLIHDIKLASQIASAIDKVITVAAKFIK
jgi:hypothetical protein